MKRLFAIVLVTLLLARPLDATGIIKLIVLFI